MGHDLLLLREQDHHLMVHNPEPASTAKGMRAKKMVSHSFLIADLRLVKDLTIYISLCLSFSLFSQLWP